MVLKQAIRWLPYMLFRLLRKMYEDYRYEQYRQKYEISPGFRFNGYDVFLYGEGRIVLGEGSYVGRGSTMEAAPGHRVEIGAGCAISHNVRIYTSSSVADQDFSGVKEVRTADVIIHDYVWIGANVFVNPGVEVGTNSVVGANSVLTRDVEPWTIVGGVPARLIRRKRVA
jgi:maltose O-acetyltransferase